MNIDTRIIQLLGGIICLVGLIGLFARISSNDGAIAITGAIIFAAGTLAEKR